MSKSKDLHVCEVTTIGQCHPSQRPCPGVTSSAQPSQMPPDRCHLPLQCLLQLIHVFVCIWSLSHSLGLGGPSVGGGKRVTAEISSVSSLHPGQRRKDSWI